MSHDSNSTHKISENQPFPTKPKNPTSAHQNQHDLSAKPPPTAHYPKSVPPTTYTLTNQNNDASDSKIEFPANNGGLATHTHAGSPPGRTCVFISGTLGQWHICALRNCYFGTWSTRMIRDSLYGFFVWGDSVHRFDGCFDFFGCLFGGSWD